MNYEGVCTCMPYERYSRTPQLLTRHSSEFTLKIGYVIVSHSQGCGSRSLPAVVGSLISFDRPTLSILTY